MGYCVRQDKRMRTAAAATPPKRQPDAGTRTHLERVPQPRRLGANGEILERRLPAGRLPVRRLRRRAQHGPPHHAREHRLSLIHI